MVYIAEQCLLGVKQCSHKAAKKTGRFLDRFFNSLDGLTKDGTAYTQSLKVLRYAIAVFRTYRGGFEAGNRLSEDFETTINLFEGVQFLAIFSSLMPKEKDQENSDLLERVTIAAFGISDLATGCLWLLSKNVPILGPYSASIRMARALDIAACGTAALGSLTDGASAAYVIKDLWNLKGPKKSAAILQLCERVTGCVSLILIIPPFSGAATASFAMGLAVGSASLGVMRFIYNWQYAKKIDKE